MYNCVLVKYGEVALRGKNRDKFEKMLMEQINRALGLCCEVKREQGRFLVETGKTDTRHAAGLIAKIPGIHSACPCVKVQTRDLAELSALCVEYMNKYHPESAAFKVATKRADKSYPLTSNEISAEIGGQVLVSRENLRVDVSSPDVTLNVELRNSTYIYSEEIRGMGGLPVSSSGSALCLLSGGIDSPVAAFQMAKRGVYSELVYFHSPPYVGEPAKQKVIDLAKRISVYMGETKLHIVRFTEVQEFLRDNVPEDKLTVFLKRSMLSIAETLAEKNRFLALIVGDSVGQVASQTLYAINSVDSAVNMPVLRPLAGSNKQEIIDIARVIGTFETSILPYEDCCTVFVPKHPDTKPKKSVIEAIERSLTELDALKTVAFESIETIPL